MMPVYLALRQHSVDVVTESGSSLRINCHCVSLVNKCRIIDKRRLFFDGVEGSSSSSLSLTSLTTTMPQADVCSGQHTDAQHHHQYAEADRQCYTIVVSMDYQQYSYISVVIQYKVHRFHKKEVIMMIITFTVPYKLSR